MTIKKIYLELTNRCNLNCKICYRQSWDELPMDMDEKYINKINNEIKKLSVTEVVLGGIGEPTFSKSIKTAINLFSSYNLTLTTNGVSMDRELKELIARHVNILVVSIDGLNETYENIRGYDLNKIIENISEVMKLKKEYDNSLFLFVEFVASKQNIDQIYGVIDLSSKLGANKVIISNIIPQTENYKTSILYDNQNEKEIKELFNKLRIYSFRKGIDLLLPNYKIVTERYCPFIESNSIVVGVDGNVYPCYRFSHNINEYIFGRHKKIYKYSFGSLDNYSLEEIYNSEEYSKFRNVVYTNRYPSCFDCSYEEGCDIALTNEFDCYTLSPSCSDCLWSRNISLCP